MLLCYACALARWRLNRPRVIPLRARTFPNFSGIRAGNWVGKIGTQKVLRQEQRANGEHKPFANSHTMPHILQRPAARSVCPFIQASVRVAQGPANSGQHLVYYSRENVAIVSQLAREQLDGLLARVPRNTRHVYRRPRAAT